MSVPFEINVMLNIKFSDVRFVHNEYYDTQPYVVHAPGLTNDLFKVISDRFFSSSPRQIGGVDDLTIITWHSKGLSSIYKRINKPLGLLEQSLDHLGVPYRVLGQDFTQWKNVYKIGITYQALKDIDTKYVLAMDSSDVLLLDDPKPILDWFIQSKCKWIFNAESIPFKSPYSPLEGPLTLSWEDFECKVGQGPYKHLNAGVWIAERDFCKEVYEFCLSKDVHELVRQNLIRGGWCLNSEQVLYKLAYPEFIGDMTLDYQCAMFQVLQKPFPMYL